MHRRGWLQQTEGAVDRGVPLVQDRDWPETGLEWAQSRFIIIQPPAIEALANHIRLDGEAPRIADPHAAWALLVTFWTTWCAGRRRTPW